MLPAVNHTFCMEVSLKWIALTLIVIGCASNQPGTYTVPGQATIQASPETVLAAARQWCADNDFVVTASSSNHLTASSNLRRVEGREQDTWSGLTHKQLAFDCGGPPAGGRGYVTDALLSVTCEAGSLSGTTLVRVTMAPKEATWGLHQCTSTGLVERSLLAAVGSDN